MVIGEQNFLLIVRRSSSVVLYHQPEKDFSCVNRERTKNHASSSDVGLAREVFCSAHLLSPRIQRSLFSRYFATRSVTLLIKSTEATSSPASHPSPPPPRGDCSLRHFVPITTPASELVSALFRQTESCLPVGLIAIAQEIEIVYRRHYLYCRNKQLRQNVADKPFFAFRHRPKFLFRQERRARAEMQRERMLFIGSVYTPNLSATQTA